MVSWLVLIHLSVVIRSSTTEDPNRPSEVEHQIRVNCSLRSDSVRGITPFTKVGWCSIDKIQAIQTIHSTNYLLRRKVLLVLKESVHSVGREIPLISRIEWSSPALIRCDISLPGWITSSQEGSQQGTIQRHGPLLYRLRERDWKKLGKPTSMNGWADFNNFMAKETWGNG